MIRLININILFLLILFFSSCGFKPIYQSTENSLGSEIFAIEFLNDPGYLIKSKILEEYDYSSSQNQYTIHLGTNQRSVPLITNTDGTVSKYRIEVTMTFNITNPNSENKIYADISRGFAEYLVQTSEIETDEKLKQAIEIATNEALQMMSIKIQSNVLQSK